MGFGGRFGFAGVGGDGGGHFTRIKESMRSHLLISFSGGETSAFLTYYLLKYKRDQYTSVTVAFANTGKERNECLDFVKKCDEYFDFETVWLECITNPEHGKGVRAKVVNYETASRAGEPYEAMIAKHGIPSADSPHCTRELKSYTIQAYLRDSLGLKKGDYVTALGIRADEPERFENKIFNPDFFLPLVSMDYTKPKINAFWEKQPFRLNLKGYEGNCNKCFKKSLRKLMTIELEEPADSKDLWWDEMEMKYENFIPESKKEGKIKPPVRFYRGNMSIKDIRSKAMSEPFHKAVDDARVYEPELDFHNGCTDACDPFETNEETAQTGQA